MLTSSAGTTSSSRRAESGVSLIEMLIVMGLLAVVTGISYPSLSAGLTSLRLRSSANSIATFLTGAVDRAERSQQAVQVIIYPKESVITAISSDSSFQKKLELGDGISIVNVLPALVSSNGEPVRRTFVIYPGGPAPRIGIEIAGSPTAHRIVALDPLTGFSRTVQP